MCTELILAFLYFFVIIIINFFLFQFILQNFKKINDLLKIKMIFTIFSMEKKNVFYALITLKEKKIFLDEIKHMVSFIEIQDFLFITNTYKFLLQTILRTFEDEKQLTFQKRKEFLTTKLYCTLVERQYFLEERK